ncbi:MAG: tetratricopeptide repeat protein [Steroidobacteraceae bacterium]
MKRIVLFWAVILLATRASAASWPNLWLTPEQQAQHLLASGHPADAARLFTDPRRRAYAALESGQFAQAARLLAPYTDTDSLYNRGNALARAGDLRSALSAYDEALKRAPNDRDTRHNRDLVARALQKQSQGHGSSPQNQGQAGSAQSQGQAGSAQSQGSQSGTPQNQQGSAPRTGPSNTGSSAGKSGTQSAAQPPKFAGSSNGTGSTSAEQAAQQRGRADAQHPGNGDDRAMRGLNDASAPASNSRNRPPSAPATPPETEQAIALDQWLRRIPDDSAELLRRKFLIEHMMRQQDRRP